MGERPGALSRFFGGHVGLAGGLSSSVKKLVVSIVRAHLGIRRDLLGLCGRRARTARMPGARGA